LVSGGFDLQTRKFRTLRQQLSFTHGPRQLQRRRPQNKIDPTLDFTAQTTITDTTATRHHVSRMLRIRIHEQSGQPQDEIMALLLFGAPAHNCRGAVGASRRRRSLS